MTDVFAFAGSCLLVGLWLITSLWLFLLIITKLTGYTPTMGNQSPSQTSVVIRNNQTRNKDEETE